MFSALKKFYLLYQKASHKFEVVVSHRDQYTQQCLEIRKKVFGDELKRVSTKDNHKIACEDTFDSSCSHMACIDTATGKVAGAVRFNSMSDFLEYKDYIQEYRIDIVDQDMLDNSIVLSRFAILQEYRDQLPVYLLAMETYKMLIERQYILACAVCEPQIFPMYRQLGFRPMGRIQVSPFGGYRLPIGLIPHDYNHLKNVCSPWLKLAKDAGFPEVLRGVEWYQNHQIRTGQFDTGFSILKDTHYDEIFSNILDDLSGDGLKSLMHHATLIQCRPGDELISEGRGEHYIGIVKSGALEVVKNNRILATLGQGDVFGEIAFILNIPRTASIIAATPDTEVILFSLKAINRLKKTEDIINFWKNLSKVLARRLVSS